MRVICPLCRASRKQELAISKGNIFNCGSCSARYVWPLPSPKNLAGEYNKKYFFKSDGVGGYFDYDDLKESLRAEAVKKLKIIKSRINSGKLLDVGAGNGEFILEAKDQGFSVVGNDISTYAVEQMKKKGLPVISGPVADLKAKNRSFNVVTAWDVFEHISNIREVVRIISECLLPGGYLFLTTPDTLSWDARMLGNMWYGYKKLPEHVLFFNRRSIEKLLRSCDFVEIESIPWGFYRSLRFITKKLVWGYMGKPGLKFLRLADWISNRPFFIPGIDFLVVARKK